MTITEAAIRYDRVTIMALAALILAGVAAFNTLPRAEDPGFIVKTALVSTYLPGASPERMEELVSDKIEQVVQQIPELDFVRSDSRTGVSLVFVNIRPEYKDMRPIWDDLRRKVERVQADLPGGVVGPFVDDEFGDVFPVLISILGDGYSLAELKDIADEVRDELLRIESVAKVQIFGAQEERIFVEYDNARLAEVGLSPSQLQGILASQNILLSGGKVTVGRESIAIEPTGSFESVDDLRRTLIQVPGRDAVLALGDLAHIRRGTVDPPASLMHTDGERSLGLAVSLREGGNISEMGREIRALLDRLPAVYPHGVDFVPAIFQPAFVDRKVDEFVENLLQAIAIVLLVMVVTLGLRTGLVVASLIPATMLITLLLMNVFGVGLNQISIAALIIALGMLVDNAIVMSESILVRLQDGMPRRQAAVESARELMVPLLTSSLTTSAAFMPMYFSPSDMGEYTGALWQVITLALLTSWALSLVMMPLLCMAFLRVEQRAAADAGGSGAPRGLERTYRGALQAVLRVPLVSVAVVLGVFLVALWGLGFVPKEYMPESDSGRLLGEFDLPLGTSIEATEAALADVEEFLAGRMAADAADGRGVLGWTAYVGSGGGPRYRLVYSPANEGSEHFSMIIDATDPQTVRQLMDDLEDFCRAAHPGLTLTLDMEAMGPGGGDPVAFRLYGRDQAELFARVDALEAHLRSVPGTRGVTNDWGPWTKKLVVAIDQARARRAGVTSQDVAVSLQTGMSGIEVTEYREGDKVIPVTLRSAAADRQDVGKLESLNVHAQATGQSVPLKQVADVSLQWEASKILRRGGLKMVTVSCQLRRGVNAFATTNAVIPWLEEQARSWPRGAFFEVGGELESSNDANEALFSLVPVVLAIMVILLVMQFNSIRRMAIIMLTIPLGLIGATVGLLVTGYPFSFFAILGVYSLAGIIINNAIVLIDRIRIEIEANGLAPAPAILAAGQARLRPILLTTTTTVGGLIPLWIFGGPLWAPMAVSIIFGLLFATLLTLGVVPLLYVLFFRVSFRGGPDPAGPGGADR
jgi:multidrug efflux pump subunit AcrB